MTVLAAVFVFVMRFYRGLGHPTANYSRASLEEIELGIQAGKVQVLELKVNAGQVLFIPEGW